MSGLRNMIANFKNIFICGLFLFMITACAEHIKRSPSEGRETKDEAKIMKKSVTLKPSGMYEECFELKKEQRLFYRFDSDRPVDFNVHFHTENEIHYPVHLNGVTQHDGMFDTGDRRFHLNTLKHYCLMWENPEMNHVNLSYECVVEEK